MAYYTYIYCYKLVNTSLKYNVNVKDCCKTNNLICFCIVFSVFFTFYKRQKLVVSAYRLRVFYPGERIKPAYIEAPLP